MTPGAEGSRQPEEPLVVRDRRRLDPETGALRTPAAQPGAAGADGTAGTPAGGPAAGTSAPAASSDDAASSEEEDPRDAEVRERTEDLRRVTAEYANYRRRQERDRATAAEATTARVLGSFLEVLDDVDRARAHGDLVGAFAGVAENLERAVTRLGLERFGEAGDPFDPNVHEALTHSLSAEVSTTTAVQVLQPGYRVGERVLRPARVAVADPDPDAPAVPTGEGADGDAAGAPEGAAGPSDGATVAGGEQQS